jgi:hypothetical protein
VKRAALLLVCVLGPVLAAATDSQYVEQTFRATGRWENGQLRAESVQLRDPYDSARRGQVTGRIHSHAPGRQEFSIGPATIAYDANTTFDRMTLGQLRDGSTVRVTGELHDGHFLARSIRMADDLGPGYVQITGQATSVQEMGDGSRELKLLEIPVWMTQPGFNSVESLTRRQGSRRPQAAPTHTLFGKPLAISSELDMDVRDRENLDLGSGDSTTDSTTEYQLEFIYQPASNVYAYLGAKAVYEADLARTSGERDSVFALERDQAWVYVERMFGSGFGLQVGRQNFKETREWWWDDDLDAARLYFDQGPFHAEAAVARELAPVSNQDDGIDPAQRDVTRYIGMASWLWAPRQKIDVFMLRANDDSSAPSPGSLVDADHEDASDARVTWYGVRASGRRAFAGAGTFEYWLDTGWVSGTDTLVSYADDVSGRSRVTDVRRVDVSGSAFDLGLSWETELPLSPTFTLGYARGSGDRTDADGSDESYRQTGLQGNKWRYAGVNRFLMYGAALRPELSNLSIATVSAGVPLLRNSSLELSYHRYEQVVASTSMREWRIDASPNGLDRDIGDGLDLVLGIRESRSIDFALTASAFRAGQAFDAADREIAWLVLAEATFAF